MNLAAAKSIVSRHYDVSVGDTLRCNFPAGTNQLCIIQCHSHSKPKAQAMHSTRLVTSYRMSACAAGEYAMKHLNQCVKVISEHLQGQTLSEYVLILVAIAVAPMPAYTMLRPNIAGE